MSIFGKCPLCGSIEWKSTERDENGVNQVVECLKCGCQRRRKPELPLQ